MAVYQKRVVVEEVTLNAISCCSCGIVFGIPADWEQVRRRDHGWWYCPNGHAQHFSALNQWEQEAKVLREKLDAAERRAAGLDASNKRLANDLMDQAKEMRRWKMRVHAGVCPHCNRHFANLERHVKTKHAEAAA